MKVLEGGAGETSFKKFPPHDSIFEWIIRFCDDDYAMDCHNNPSLCKSGENYIAYSSLFYYDLYKDSAPIINKFTVNRPTGTTSYSNLKIAFNVSDLLDNYKYLFKKSQ